MKKLIALLLALVMAMSLAACCCNCDEQIAVLHQEITTLKAQIDEKNQTIPEETVPEETVLHESIPTENQDVVREDFLAKLANSDNPDNWLEVAKCNFATEKLLLEVAKKCAALDTTSGDYTDMQTQLGLLKLFRTTRRQHMLSWQNW